MSTINTLTGISGILRPFKEYLLEKKLSENSQIVYYGCLGTCIPFIELLAYATRDLHLTQVIVPLLDESEARRLKMVSGFGIQLDERIEGEQRNADSCATGTCSAIQVGDPITVNPAIIVLMGGLAMPGVPVTAGEAKILLSRHDVPVIGVCFMSMFQKSGWLKEIDLDLLIDATINPVTITRRA